MTQASNASAAPARNDTSTVRSVVWERVDGAGTDFATVAIGKGIQIRGTAVATNPLPYAVRYTMTADPDLQAHDLDLDVEGAGWSRQLQIRHHRADWRITTQESGDLDAALAAAGHAAAPLPGMEDTDRLAAARDLEVDALPATLTPLLRPPNATGVGEPVEALVAVVLVPSLAVVADTVRITMPDPRTALIAGGERTITVEVDDDAVVRNWPGLVRRLS